MRELTANEQSELTNVAWHWDSAYQVGFDGDVFVAHRLGYPEHVLTGETPADLREQIRCDYQSWMASLREGSSL